MNRLKATQHAMLLRLIALLTLPFIACNLPQTAPATPLPTNPPQPTDTPTPAPTLSPTTTSTPAPTPIPSDLVWFAPNMGSRDYAELFTKPEQWSVARSRIDVFKFYTQNVLEYPCAICGDNTLDTFVEAGAFQKLTEWGIAIAVEVGAVKEWGCTGQEEFRVAKEVIRNVQAHGGTVSLLAMDEPFIGGQLVIDGHSCGHNMYQSAKVTSQFIRQVNASFPQILVGDIEPYPYFSVPELEDWLLTLENRGITPAFFHLDVDIERVRVEGSNVKADLQELSQFLQMHGIPFGVIFTSNWHAAGSDRAYFDSTMGWIQTVKDAIGKPQHVIIQSWQAAPADRKNRLIHDVPINLPESDPSIFSHTRLILEGLDVFDR
jgi:hypothetical protein